MDKEVKSGKEILDAFFEEISNIKNVDTAIAELLSNLYGQGKLTEANLKNELQELREKNGTQN